MLVKTFTGLWSKYRPVILKMMIDSAGGSQSYRLSEHEFHAFNNMKKGSYTFALTIAQGKVVSGMRDSLVAQDLWEILQMSPKAGTLLSEGGFIFTMDKEFVLRIERKNTSN